MNKTGIEYLDFTWNPIAMRCTPVSEGCANCWHLSMCDRLAQNPKMAVGIENVYSGALPPHLVESRLADPLKRKKPARIGVQFMGDLFHKDITRNMFDAIDSIFIVMAAAKQHTFVVLTKRPDEMLRWYQLTGILGGGDYYKNIWIGVAAENQEQAGKRIPVLLQIPAAVRFVSVEPMLGPVDVSRYLKCESCIDPSVCWCNDPILDWVVIGCESGPKRRPCKPGWITDLLHQCELSGVPAFLKQMDTFGKIIKMPRFYGKVWDQYPGGF